MTGTANGTQGSNDLQAKLQRWSQKLGALPNLALPTDYPRPSEPDLELPNLEADAQVLPSSLRLSKHYLYRRHSLHLSCD